MRASNAPLQRPRQHESNRERLSAHRRNAGAARWLWVPCINGTKREASAPFIQRAVATKIIATTFAGALLIPEWQLSSRTSSVARSANSTRVDIGERFVARRSRVWDGVGAWRGYLGGSQAPAVPAERSPKGAPLGFLTEVGASHPVLTAPLLAVL